MTSSLRSAPASRMAWTVLVVAATAYFLAVVHRSALGVAGIEALDRLGTEATGLAALSVVQIAVYAGLQLPAGSLLDRFGPRAVLVAGSLIMAVGQALMATADSLALAIVARVLIGAGDAPVFVAANRLIIDWFPPRRVPFLVQAMAVLGQVGQLATAIPVAWLLHAQGWSVTFAVLAGLGLAVGMLAVFRIRVPPSEPLDAASGPPPSIGMRQALRPPGVQLGFWTHFTGLFSANTVALLWGVPFMVQAHGLSPAQASGMLSVMVGAKIVVAPFAGAFTSRHPLRRSWMVLGFAVIVAAVWASVLIPGTPRPLWHLALLMIVVGVGGPTSVVGMDYARTFGDRRRVGTAVAFANIGGFASTVIAVLLIGLVLQAVSPAGATEYTLGEYRLAFTMLAVPWVIGVIGVVTSRRRTRRAMAADGIIVPSLRQAYRDGRRL